MRSACSSLRTAFFRMAGFCQAWARAPVSVRQLQHPTHPKRFAPRRRQRASKPAHSEKAVRKLEQALRIDPEYAEARCNLGVEYIRKARYPEALEQFEKALAGGAIDVMVYSNLCYAYYALGRWKEAEQAARRALALDDRYAARITCWAPCWRVKSSPRLWRRLRKRHVTSASAPMKSRAPISISPGSISPKATAWGAAEEVKVYLKTADKNYRAAAEEWLEVILKN